MNKHRDSQRARVYAWERACMQKLSSACIYTAEFQTLDECASFAEPIWRKERGRMGMGHRDTPAIERPAWGQRHAVAHEDHRITLPRWARHRWVILHEMAHLLNVKHDVRSHGPRFVGLLIGLVARWLEYDAQQLMHLADEMGVKYHVRTIGVVPVRGPTWHVERVIRQDGPMTDMDLACHLSLIDGIQLTPAQVRGAALQLIRTRRARWIRRKLTPTAPNLSA